MKLCDLHTHSVFSDGTYTPAEIVKEALTLGLSAVALCDHNTVDGLTEFIKAAEETELEAIPGAEFSVNYLSTELHLLALFIPESQFDKITATMERFRQSKTQANLAMIASLNSSGYNISYEKILQSTPNGNFNRTHVAKELTRLGYTGSVKEAFETLLSPSAGHCTEPDRLDFFKALDFIKEIGAVPVLAHPFLNLKEEELEALLPLAKEKGLAGIECFYSLYDKETTEKSLTLADKYSLKCSGGSDFHGSNKPSIKLGTGKGNLAVPFSLTELLKP